MKLMSRLVVAALAVLSASASAFAAPTYLSGTATSTNANSNLTVSSLQSLIGAPDGANGTPPTNVAQIQSGASNQSDTWIISAGMTIDLSASNTITIDIWAANDQTSSLTVTLSRIRFIDNSGNTATLTTSPLPGNINPGTGNNGVITQFTFNTNYTNYTLVGAFSRANIVSITFDISLSSFGNGKNQWIDALGVTGGAAIPEPGSIALFGLGALGLGAFARMKRRRKSAATTS